MVEKGGSDLHVKSGSTPKIRIDGEITELAPEILSPQSVDGIMRELMTEKERFVFSKDQEVDFIYEVNGLGRFRVNVYRQMMGLALAIRHIRIDIPTFEELNLPEIIYSLIDRQRGLLLVTGATGSGKSTTLAAMIETLNRTRPLNIITIEDPIEFAFIEKKCTIQQREVGRDTPSWTEAQRRILRQDPDVIMLGEIRDWESMITALTAANTGHLVLSTMHTMDAAQSINRAISFAPPAMAGEVRILLAATLVGIVSLRLLPRSDQRGRVPAVEVLVATETVRKAIVDPDEVQNIKHIITEGHIQYQMQTFDQSLMDLQHAGLITMDEALKYATSPTDFRIRARGIEDRSKSAWDADGEGENMIFEKKENKKEVKKTENMN